VPGCAAIPRPRGIECALTGEPFFSKFGYDMLRYNAATLCSRST
jgi:hypothetical protein